MAAAGEFFELPEPIIQLIQSFLTPKEATQTTLLSKSWLGAWHTRPNLVFDRRDYSPSLDIRFKTDIVLDYAEKAIRRYEMSNLNIQSFILDNLETSCTYNSGRLTNLILGGLKLGATRFGLRAFSCLGKYKLPNEVFAFENLVSLELGGVEIDLGPNPVAFSMLRSLILKYARIKSRDMLLRIISSCPLIEELKFRCVMLADNHGFGFCGDGGLIELHRLRSLLLDRTDTDTLFLDGLSSKFPSLTDLSLRMLLNKKARKEILISSPSIKRLGFNIRRDVSADSNMIRVEFDLPSICKLTFEGSGNRYWIHRPGSMGWESDDDDVSITHHHKCLTPNTMDFLGVTLLQGLNVRISNLGQLMYGLNDLKEARARISDKDGSVWSDVPLLDDSTVPEDSPYVGFQLIWQPKQKKLN